VSLAHTTVARNEYTIAPVLEFTKYSSATPHVLLLRGFPPTKAVADFLSSS
jgi:hypothetical protein